MENYYSELMARYLTSRKCDDSFIKYLFGKGVQRKTTEELERADERKRRLQRERSRRYRALKSARRREESTGDGRRDAIKYTHDAVSENSRVRRSGSFTSEVVRDDEDSSSGNEDPPTLCKITEDFVQDGKQKHCRLSSCSESVSDENSTHSFPESKDSLSLKNVPMNLKDFLNTPSNELDYSTVHSLMFQWLQT